MANKQTRQYRKDNLSTKVVKGTAIPRDGKPGMGTSLTEVEFASTKGRHVDPSKERAARKTASGKERQKWKGHGNPLGR